VLSSLDGFPKKIPLVLTNTDINSGRTPKRSQRPLRTTRQNIQPHLYWERPPKYVHEGVSVEARKIYRATTFVVLGVLVCGSGWLDGCGANVSLGGSSAPAINGTIVDASTKSPIAGALVVLEQGDPNGTDRIVASTFSASDGTFGFNPSASGTFDVVADATIPTTGTPITYAATITFGVPAKAGLNQIPWCGNSGSRRKAGSPRRSKAE
jgi:hypothetical protein